VTNRFRVRPGQTVNLRQYDPADTQPFKNKKKAIDKLDKGLERLAKLQEQLYAQDRWAVLLIFQAMDAAGKDSTIAHVMSGVDPQGCQVYSFKAPSEEELRHDFLWRTTLRLPARGHIGIFNRSYYEEVLVVRVHPQLLEKLPNGMAGQEGAENGIWQHRFREINNYERYLSENGVRIVKLFLNLSRDAQRGRFISRIDEPAKNWKFTASDVRERAFWDAYQAAFSDVLSNTSTKWAPWYVVPADNKWFSRLVAAAAIGKVLADIDPQYPTVSADAKASLDTARRELEAESPPSKRSGKTKNGKKKAGGR
jgi:PPK2 family polyphosphate:nucleotide phosphotransferase